MEVEQENRVELLPLDGLLVENRHPVLEHVDLILVSAAVGVKVHAGLR